MFTIELAGIRIGIAALHDGLAAFCTEYLVNAEPDFVLRTTEADLAAEGERASEYAHGGRRSAIELEKLWLYRQIAEAIPAYDTFLIHATAVRVDDDAFLFLGPSGTGKTTHAQLWKRHFGDRLRVINDDKPLLRLHGQEIRVHGSPWCGKERWQSNISAPLRAIFCLHQSERNRARPMGKSEAWEHVLNQLYRSAEPDAMRATLAFADALIRATPLYYLECTKDEEAVAVALSACGNPAARRSAAAGATPSPRASGSPSPAGSSR